MDKKRTSQKRADRKQSPWERAMHISRISLGWNVCLSAFKLWAGISGHSQAMITDAAHSASDVLSTLVVMAGVRISSKTSDKGHPYGHERLECVSSVILACMLFVTGMGIGLQGVRGVVRGNLGAFKAPGALPLAAALISIAVKEGMYRYTKRGYGETGFSSLMADAWHHRSDALSSIGALIGICGARAGAAFLDPLAGVAISAMIIQAAVHIFRTAMDQMVDKACKEEVEEQIRRTACSVEGVERVDVLRTRRFGARVYVDIEIAANAELTLFLAHRIAEQVHDAVEGHFPEVKHCMVHVNPFQEPGMN